MTFEWSKYQQAIFDEVKNGKGNIVVEALAGSSKTTVLVEATNHIPKGKKILLCAFNKRIKEELDTRVSNPDVKCLTLHSLGFSAVKKAYPNVRLDNKKMDDIINGMKFRIPDSDYSKIMNSIKQAASLSKSMVIDTPSKIRDIVIEYDIDYTPYDIDEFVNMVFKCIEKSKTIKDVIDFSDMVWFPVIFDLKVETFDYVLIDETQDISKCSFKLALKAKNKDARLFVWLDKNQCIYQFNGSGGEQVLQMVDEIGGVKLPLPICYRCPNKVIEMCKKYAPNMESFPGNKDGEISNITYSKMLEIIPKGSFVLSRYNAPLVPIYFSLLKMGKPAFIIGKDIGNNLNNIVKNSKTKSVTAFKLKIEQMKASEIARAKKERRSTDLIEDKYECIEEIAETCATVKELSDKINKMFIDVPEKDKSNLMSIHRAKGLENSNVFLLKNTLSPDSADQAERNIYYVGISRSKDKLYFVEKDKKK